MKKKIVNVFSLVLISTIGISSTVQGQEKSLVGVKDTIKVSTPKVGSTTNVMLNASSDNGPRDVNIGLPKSVGGTVVLENGLPVVYDFSGQFPTTVWRQDNGIAKFNVLNDQRQLF